jgi:hypothetical protein
MAFADARMDPAAVSPFCPQCPWPGQQPGPAILPRRLGWIRRFLHPIGNPAATPPHPGRMCEFLPACEVPMEALLFSLDPKNGLGLGVIATIILKLIQIVSFFTR